MQKKTPLLSLMIHSRVLVRNAIFHPLMTLTLTFDLGHCWPHITLWLTRTAIPPSLVAIGPGIAEISQDGAERKKHVETDKQSWSF